jgi:cytochrome c2
MRMCRTYQLVTVVFIFLSACNGGTGTNKGGGTESNTGGETINEPAPTSGTDQHSGGPDLFSKYACFTCHSLEGKVMYGPPLNGLFMTEVSVVRQGEMKTVIADRDYLTRSITDPDYEKVTEYQSKVMPKPEIPGDDVETLIDYLIEQGEKDTD